MAGGGTEQMSRTIIVTWPGDMYKYVFVVDININ